jgi:hypothetical protein
MRLVLAFSVMLALTTPVQAAPCHGQNLIAALSAADRNALKITAEWSFCPGNLWQGHCGAAQITLKRVGLIGFHILRL